MQTILIVEDDGALARGLAEVLRSEHYRAVSVPTCARGLAAILAENPDLIILDLMLPDGNGMDLCAELRRRGIPTPILMLTSRTDEVDRVLGLETGADDYVTKPFGTRELVARIRALLRRSGQDAAAPPELHTGDVWIHFRRMEARKGNETLHLTVLEYRVLEHLASRRGEPVSREDLLRHVWGYERFPTTRTVDACILSLRKKLETDPSSPRLILTLHGVGYRLAGES
ncbi:MAG: response regulator transcription factor [Bacteroidota bacterium]